MADVSAASGRMFAEIVLGADLDDRARAVDRATRCRGRVRGRRARRGVRPRLGGSPRGAGRRRRRERPDDPREQLDGAIERRLHVLELPAGPHLPRAPRIPHDLGTAVVVQAMVFGNLGSPSGSGVAFTRDPVDRRAGALRRVPRAAARARRSSPAPARPRPRRGRPGCPELFAELGRDRCAELERRVPRRARHRVHRRGRHAVPAAGPQRQAHARGGRADRRRPARRRHCRRRAAALRPGHRRPDPPGRSARVRRGGRRAGPGRRRLAATGIGASPGQVSGELVLDPDRAADARGRGHRSGPGPADHQPARPARHARGHRASSPPAAARPATPRSWPGRWASPASSGAHGRRRPPGRRACSSSAAASTRRAPSCLSTAPPARSTRVLPRGLPDRNTAIWSVAGVADALSRAVWLPASTPAALAESGSRRGRPWGRRPDRPARRLDRRVQRCRRHHALSRTRRTGGQGRGAVRPPRSCGSSASCSRRRGDLAVDLRLPVFTSPRARRLIEEWASLAPASCVPLGPRRLLAAYLPRSPRPHARPGTAGRPSCSAGSTDPAGDRRVRRAWSARTRTRAGAVLTNPTVLFAADRLVAPDRALWVDLHELSRAAPGIRTN